MSEEKEKEKHEAELAEELVKVIIDDNPNSDLNGLYTTYGFRKEELGRLTGYSLRLLEEWAAGKFPIEPAFRRLNGIKKLLDALSEVVKRDSIAGWLRKPNKAFGQLTPLQIIEVGEIDRLWGMIYSLETGNIG